MMRIFFLLVAGAVFAGCGSVRSSFNPNKKFSPQQLEKDYTVFQTLLEKNHPGLYWYTSRDSMDYYFNWGREQIKDSLTETQFRNIIAYVLAKINCGHTTARPSKNFSRYLDTTRDEKLFPLSFKFWDKTVVVTGNLHRKDTVLARGSLVHSINNMPMQKIVDTLFKFISSDGYNLTHKYQMLSNRGNFGNLYTNVFGYSPRYQVAITDTLGRKRTVTVPIYIPARDTSMISAVTRLRSQTKKEKKFQRLQAARQLKIDTANNTAYLDVSTFGRGVRLKRFFRQSFRYLRQHQVQYLVIDLRSNGGGSVTNSTLLTKYISDKPFKVADSLYAISRSTPYHHYIKNYFLNKLFLVFFTRKKKDGHYHFGYYETHFFKPKRKNHFNGKTYVLIGGNSFSATTLFAEAVAKQDDVILVGEETGGGAYGNTAWLIPDVRLPETKVEFRLPLFRLVIDKTVPKNGRGIQPEVFSGPNVEAIRRNEDYKMKTVLQLIEADKSKQ